MKLSQKLLLSVCSIGLLMTANSSAWAADAPKKDSSVSEEQRRDSIRQKRREASMRERDALMKREPRRDSNSTAPSGTNNSSNNSNNAAHTPPAKPERPAKPARGGKRGGAAAN